MLFVVVCLVKVCLVVCFRAAQQTCLSDFSKAGAVFSFPFLAFYSSSLKLFCLFVGGVFVCLRFVYLFVCLFICLFAGVLLFMLFVCLLIICCCLFFRAAQQSFAKKTQDQQSSFVICASKFISLQLAAFVLCVCLFVCIQWTGFVLLFVCLHV